MTTTDLASHNLQGIDFCHAVEQLHSLELTKIIPKLKSDARFAQVPQVDKGPSKISVPALVKGLPFHIIRCLLARRPIPHADSNASSSAFEHAGKAFQLLFTLSDMCTELPPLRENGYVGPDPFFTAQLIDATNLALLTVAGPEADTILESCTKVSAFRHACHRAALVPMAIRCLAIVVSAQAPRPSGRSSGDFGDRYNWLAVCQTLFSHPRGPVLLDSIFEASRVLVFAVRRAMCTDGIDGNSVYELAYSAGGAIELLTTLCACPLFYHRLMLHNPQGSLPLQLILACLGLHDAPLAVPPFARLPLSSPTLGRPVLKPSWPPYSTDKGRGAAELLAARGFALLLLLGEYESPMFLDEVFSGSRTREMAEELVGRSAAYVGQVVLRPSVEAHPPPAGEGQMAINVLRAAELLADDSNFRVTLIPGLAPTLAQLLGNAKAAPFVSLWCGGEAAVQLQGTGAEILINSCSKKSMDTVNKYASAAREYYGSSGRREGERQCLF